MTDFPEKSYDKSVKTYIYIKMIWVINEDAYEQDFFVHKILMFIPLSRPILDALKKVQDGEKQPEKEATDDVRGSDVLSSYMHIIMCIV